MKSADTYDLIYSVVLSIPAGTVATYGQVAEIAGLPGRSRQVGYAMSALKNRENDPRYADVPWQRVVNHEGRIVIKGSEHGRFYQAELLREEGVEVSKELKINLDKYLWDGLLPHEVREIIEDK